MQAADIHTSARAFSLIVASWAPTKGNSTTRHKQRRCGCAGAPRTPQRALRSLPGGRASRSNREARGLLAARGTFSATTGVLVAGRRRSAGRSACEPLSVRARGRGGPLPWARTALRRADRWVGGGSLHEGNGAAWRSRTTPNVTPEEDYRTALLSDSPNAGCSLGGW